MSEPRYIVVRLTYPQATEAAVACYLRGYTAPTKGMRGVANRAGDAILSQLPHYRAYKAVEAVKAQTQ